MKLVLLTSLIYVHNNNKQSIIILGEYDPRNRDWAHRDRKDGGWLGGAMAAVGNRFVACGSRWVNQKYKNAYLMSGICYWIPKNHVIANMVNETWPWLPPKYSYRLSAFLKESNTFFIKVLVIRFNTI